MALNKSDMVASDESGWKPLNETERVCIEQLFSCLNRWDCVVWDFAKEEDQPWTRQNSDH